MSFSFNDQLVAGATPLDPNETAQLKLKHLIFMKELDESEAQNIANALVWLRKQRNKDPLTVPFVLQLHLKMFGDVWSWAGVYRKSEKNIGVPWPQVPQAVAELLHKTHIWIQEKRYNWDELGVRFHHRLVQIHPFPNGNGRHSRLITDFMLRKYKQKEFTWGRVGTQISLARTHYLQALRAADERNFEPLLAFVRTN